MTAQSPLYPTSSLHTFIIVLFEKYTKLLESQFSKRFDDASDLSVLSRRGTLTVCVIDHQAGRLPSYACSVKPGNEHGFGYCVRRCLKETGYYQVNAPPLFVIHIH